MSVELLKTMRLATGLVNELAIFAAPKVYARARKSLTAQQLRAEILKHIEELLALDVSAIFGEGYRLSALQAACPAVRRALTSESDADGLSEATIASSRQALASFGIPEPAEGWDSFAPLS